MYQTLKYHVSSDMVQSSIFLNWLQSVWITGKTLFGVYDIVVQMN